MIAYEHRKDGTYAYNPVTDRYWKVSDYSRESMGKSSGSIPNKWSYAGIKADLDHCIYNGEGLINEHDQNMYERIHGTKMSSSERSHLESLLSQALTIGKRRMAEYGTGKKESLITEYKNAWRGKNALWRFFHQKSNPRKMNFDSMSQLDIEKETKQMKKR